MAYRRRAPFSRGGSTRGPFATVGIVAAGVVVALGLVEIVLRILVTRAPMPLPRILADSFDAPVVASRQIDEGIATSHFSITGARLTGNPPVNAGATVVIVGDSYVVAREVSDRETMGADLERIARAQAFPLDVRQYGWTGASPARYLLAAPEVLERWHPLRVIIPMADNDLDFNAAELAWPLIRVAKTGTLRIVGPHVDPAFGSAPRSVIAMLARHRWTRLHDRAPSWARRIMKHQWTTAGPAESAGEIDTSPDSAELAALPDAVVRALAEAYGSKLVLIYLAEVGVSGGDSVTGVERRFLDGCSAYHVTCASTRADMLDARRRGIVTRGAVTTVLGAGHLNARGHQLVAAEMWTLLRTIGPNAAASPAAGVPR
jgi:hypothetical protein